MHSTKPSFQVFSGGVGRRLRDMDRHFEPWIKRFLQRGSGAGTPVGADEVDAYRMGHVTDP
jgi:hypothetical protein